MFSQYLGSYLLRRELISAEELGSLLKKEKEHRIKLGVLAIDRGYMTVDQVEEIHAQQKKIDCRFGELALNKGYLTPLALEKLLTEQKEAHVSLSEILVAEGYFSLAEIEKIVREYKEDAGISDRDIRSLQEGDVAVAVDRLVEFNKPYEFFRNYVILFLRNLIRFVDPRSRNLSSQEKIETPKGLVIEQAIRGEVNINTAVMIDNSDAGEIASRFSRRDISSPDPLISETLKELLNLHNGLFAVNLSNEGVEVNLNPPEVAQQAPYKFSEEIEFRTSVGDIKLFLGS